MDKYQKFELAMQRLAKERDIIHVLQHNRVSDFLLKAKFLARQRRAINHSHKYVITDKDLRVAKGEDQELRSVSSA